jgi:hypothetical protein
MKGKVSKPAAKKKKKIETSIELSSDELSSGSDVPIPDLHMPYAKKITTKRQPIRGIFHLQRYVEKAQKRNHLYATTRDINYHRGDIYVYRFEHEEDAMDFKPNDGARGWRHQGRKKLVANPKKKTMATHNIHYHRLDRDNGITVRKHTYFPDANTLVIHYYLKTEHKDSRQRRRLQVYEAEEPLGSAMDTDSSTAPSPKRKPINEVCIIILHSSRVINHTLDPYIIFFSGLSPLIFLTIKNCRVQWKKL